jgi:predicted CoA-substrate-specific enzyme activase
MTEGRGIYAGVDAGSRAIKLVILDTDDWRILASVCVDQAIRQTAAVHELMQRALAEAGLPGEGCIRRVVATGYGRRHMPFEARAVTEITCHARGVAHRFPGVRSVIDIGGQDSKLIRLNPKGQVHDFTMNDRCAAGTGRFLEIAAKRLELDLADAGVGKVTVPAVISSMCVVFAETEIIGLLADGETPENIFAGIQNAVASRILAMAGRTVEPPVVFTGGVARIDGMRDALAHAMGCEIAIAADPQMTGALGAALIAAEDDGVGALPPDM